MTDPSPFSLDRPLRLRFAPSPTGELHVGGLRTALFNYLLKLRTGGTLVFRLEDTDVQRNVPGAEARILDLLAWAGVVFDEGPSAGGPYAPYRQSEATSHYYQALAQLQASRWIYYCWCEPERLEAVRQAALSQGRPPRYDRRCRRLSDEERNRLQESGRSAAIRLATPESGRVELYDEVKGTVIFAASDLDDPILVRSNGAVTGLFAAAVDDHRMRIDLVLRGEEWLPSTPYQLLIHRGLGGPEPAWGHLPLLLAEDRTKLSKRHPGGTVADLRMRGILPEALCRHLVGIGHANLPENTGWDLKSLAALFNPSDYARGGAVFTLPALINENAAAIKRLSPPELARRAQPFVTAALPTAEVWDEATWAQRIDLVAPHARTLRELAEETAAVFGFPEVDPGLRERFPDWERLLMTTARRVGAVGIRNGASPWTLDSIKQALNYAAADLGLAGRDFFLPLRVALTGRTHGPELPRLIAVLGRDDFLRRIELALSRTRRPG